MNALGGQIGRDHRGVRLVNGRVVFQKGSGFPILIIYRATLSRNSMRFLPILFEIETVKILLKFLSVIALKVTCRNTNQIQFVSGTYMTRSLTSIRKGRQNQKKFFFFLNKSLSNKTSLHSEFKIYNCVL